MQTDNHMGPDLRRDDDQRGLHHDVNTLVRWNESSATQPATIATTDRQAGFTLIELLVSLTIMGVVFGLLGTSLRGLSQGWDRQTNMLADLDMLQRGFNQLRRDVEAMQRLVWQRGNPQQFVFQGRETSLQFVSIEPPYPSRPGAYFLSFVSKARANGRALVRRRAPFSTRPAAFSQVPYGAAVVLIEGGYLPRFSYGDAHGGALRWYKNWPHNDRYPDLIRLSVTNAREGRLQMPPFVIRLRADAEQLCVVTEDFPCTLAADGLLAQSQPNARGAKTKNTAEGSL